MSCGCLGSTWVSMNICIYMYRIPDLDSTIFSSTNYDTHFIFAEIPLQNSTIPCTCRFLCVFPDIHDVMMKLCDDYLEDVWTDHKTRFLQVLCTDSLDWEGLRFFLLPSIPYKVSWRDFWHP